MIGIDTNCLLRYALRDDARQHRAIEARLTAALESGEDIFINDIVLVEFVWVLKSTFSFTREMLAAAVDGLLDGQQFVFEKRETIQAALDDFGAGRADFSDCLIGAKNKRAGCAATFTFDRDAAKLKGFEYV